ncbi:alpha/beta hydrolase [Pseudomaricurvus sp.]|uniref:alpha/beta hydrolase n=1 Tax=Pseudomaricurvus sp. TaxID=2004510 RepID=UPI003F6C8D58
MRRLNKLLLCMAGALSLLHSGGFVSANHHEENANKEAPVEHATGPYIKPDVRAYLDNLKAHPRPKFTRQMLTMIHKLPPEKMKNTDDLPVGDLATVEDVIMPGPDGDIRMRLYDSRAEREAGPVVVFFHGGGFVVGSIETHEGLTAEMARQLDLPVISVNYRLAPESPWPAAVDDGEAAARWVAENSKAFDRNFTGLIISGDSAGGNITLVTTLALRDKPAALPVIMQLPIYPASDSTKKYPSAEQFGQGFALDISDDKNDFYAADPQSVRTSPLLANLEGLPPTVLVTASLDPLRDQGRAYAAKLIEAGVPTIYYEAKGNIHGFATYRKAIPSAQQDTLAFLRLANAMLKEVLSDVRR